MLLFVFGLKIPVFSAVPKGIITPNLINVVSGAYNNINAFHFQTFKLNYSKQFTQILEFNSYGFEEVYETHAVINIFL